MEKYPSGQLASFLPYSAYRRMKPQRQLLLVYLDLVDSLQRVMTLSFPQGTTRSARRFARGLQRLLAHANAKHKEMMQSLEYFGVHPIPLRPGEYPPPDTTRVVARVDEGIDDDIVISEIALPGYEWNGSTLRKADVLVTSAKETI